MASIQTITNTPAGSGNGDTAYVAANKINSNFTNVNNAKLEKGSYTGTAADLKSDIDNLSFSGLKSYDTRAELYAVTEPSGTPAKVVNDPTTNYNGYYSSNGSTWSKDSYQPGDGANAGSLNGLTSSQFVRSDVLSTLYNGSGMKGSGTGTNNTALFPFFESDGTTSQGYIGFRDTTTDSLVIRNRISEKELLLDEDGELKYNGDADFSGSVEGASFKTTAWEIIEESGILKFKYNGSTKFQFKSTGVVEAADHKNGLI